MSILHVVQNTKFHYLYIYFNICIFGMIKNGSQVQCGLLQPIKFFTGLRFHIKALS